MSDSVQHKIGRNRPPRVQITYDVETGNALEKKEIPFVVGIIAPLSGKSTKPSIPMPEKKMVYIDRDNFNKVLDSIAPRVAFGVPNKLPNGSGELMVSVEFNHIDHFNPIEVVKRVPALNEIYAQRSRLRDFLAKLDGNGPLNHLLLDILCDKARREKLITSVSDSTKEMTQKVQADEEEGKLTNPDEWNKMVLESFKKALDEDNSDVALLVNVKKSLMILEDNQIPYALELIGEFVVLLSDATNSWNEVFKDIDPLIEKQIAAVTEKETKEKDYLEKKNGSDEAAIKTSETALIEAIKTLESLNADVTKLRGNLNIAGELTQRVGRKDLIISRQLNYIIHDDDFQAMEASWRGLHYLVMNTETNTKLKLRLLNATYDELYKDLDKAVDFDQSALFRLIYEEEYGTYGGEPYSVLIGDFQLGRSARDIRFLELISGVAAAAHAPFIASAWAKLFDLDDYSNLYKPRDLSKIFESAELIQWRAFIEKEDSRYVTLTLPKVMLRLPYHHENNPVEGIYFDEDVAVNVTTLDKDGNEIHVTDVVDGLAYEKTKKEVNAKKILWGNPAYVLGQRITNAFSLYGWTAAIRGVEGGGLIEGLPAYTFETEDGDKALSCPTQVSITDRREKELDGLGFMSICHCKGTNKAAFFGGKTTNKAKTYLTDSATANAEISSMLPYVMAASRFAHYIKVIMREKIGSFMTRQNVENYLNTWIAQYVLLDDTPPQHIKAKYPLREARIEVSDIAGKPGCYKATVFLRPHFQLEELTTSIRLVAELPA